MREKGKRKKKKEKKFRDPDGTVSLEYQRVKEEMFRFDLKDEDARRWKWKRKWR